jgi:hypothetical protein
MNIKAGVIYIENEDLVDLIHASAKFYKFHLSNNLPSKIVIPLMPSVRDYNTSAMIPVEFVPFVPTPTVESDLAEKKGAAK